MSAVSTFIRFHSPHAVCVTVLGIFCLCYISVNFFFFKGFWIHCVVFEEDNIKVGSEKIIPIVGCHLVTEAVQILDFSSK